MVAVSANDNTASLTSGAGYGRQAAANAEETVSMAVDTVRTADIGTVLDAVAANSPELEALRQDAEALRVAVHHAQRVAAYGAGRAEDDEIMPLPVLPFWRGSSRNVTDRRAIASRPAVGHNVSPCRAGRLFLRYCGA